MKTYKCTNCGTVYSHKGCGCTKKCPQCKSKHAKRIKT